MRSEIEDFCERMYPRLVASLGLYTGDGYVAEELAQEALARAWRDWKRVHKMEHPEAWTFSVGFNLARTLWRRKAAEGKARDRLTKDPIPDEDIADRETVRAALKELPPRQRQAIILRYYLGFSYSEMATTMDCPGATARSYVRRALQRMRVSIDPDVLKEEANAT